MALSHVLFNNYINDTEVLHSVDTKQLKGSSVITFHSALFVRDLLWICGWNKNIIGQKSIVFLEVQADDYGILSKNELKHPGADQPMVMFNAQDKIFFAKRDGREIHSFNTQHTKIQ